MGRGQGKEGTKCLDSDTGWGVRCLQNGGLMPFPYERGGEGREGLRRPPWDMRGGRQRKQHLDRSHDVIRTPPSCPGPRRGRASHCGRGSGGGGRGGGEVLEKRVLQRGGADTAPRPWGGPPRSALIRDSLRPATEQAHHDVPGVSPQESPPQSPAARTQEVGAA